MTVEHAETATRLRAEVAVCLERALRSALALPGMFLVDGGDIFIAHLRRRKPLAACWIALHP